MSVCKFESGFTSSTRSLQSGGSGIDGDAPDGSYLDQNLIHRGALLGLRSPACHQQPPQAIVLQDGGGLDVVVALRYGVLDSDGDDDFANSPNLIIRDHCGTNGKLSVRHN